MTSVERLGPDERAELEEQRDFLLRSLDDLEAERQGGELDDADYRALKDDYTARAAAVLRALDDDSVAVTATRPPRRWGRLAAAAIAVTALAVGAGLLVARSSDDRDAGDTLTGQDLTSAGELLAEAERLADSGDVLEAVQTYDQVLNDDPDNAEALAKRGYLLLGLAPSVKDDDDRALLRQRGVAAIEQALEVDPTYPYAHRYYADVLLARGDLPGAVREMRLFIANDPVPADAAQARKDLAQLEKAAKEGT